MADIRVRKLDDWVVEVHRRLASGEGSSLENHLRVLLTEAAIKSQLLFADRAEARLKSLQASHGALTDSSELIRQERWDRG
jgi:hypothetical protein